MSETKTISLNGVDYELVKPVTDVCQQCTLNNKPECEIVQCCCTDDEDAPEENRTNWVFKKI